MSLSPKGPCWVSSDVQEAGVPAVDRRCGALCAPWKGGYSHFCRWPQPRRLGGRGQCEGSFLAWCWDWGVREEKRGWPTGFGQLTDALGTFLPPHGTGAVGAFCSVSKPPCTRAPPAPGLGRPFTNPRAKWDMACGKREGG
ncbi:hypothetical protein HJG60_009819 [Phyllostomus discolor]|uniref:Uncharacterized protein n=1 Tax=Phyllostomus discolor TaxID=89673 RepID=A0A834BCB6_9CHIR|nr:hypothetical protein HJG60_009819 [Phyllostomus discolor]